MGFTDAPLQLRQRSFPYKWCHWVFLTPNWKDLALAQANHSLASFLSDHPGQTLSIKERSRKSGVLYVPEHSRELPGVA